MSSDFTVRPTMHILTNTDFIGSGTISRAARPKLASRIFPEPDMIRSSTTSEKTSFGVRISHTSVLDDLSDERTISHRFHFIDRMETRERFHLVTPDDPSVTTEILVAFDEGKSRDYFSISTYDSDGMIAATETLVYNDEGKIVPYPFTDDLVSQITVDDVRLEEVLIEGIRTLKFEVSLEGLDREVNISLLWESIGSIDRKPFTCGPDNSVAAIFMPLEGNPRSHPCDWVAIAVDEKDRVLAQAHFALDPSVGRSEGDAWPFPRS